MANRNAASHLWSAFLMDHAATMPLDRYNQLSAGYCAVSGSPVTPQQRTRYRMTLDSVTGGRVTGIVYYCCWPFVCDTQDFIKIDTKTITTAEGSSVHRFMVIGNPCKQANRIPSEAPEVRCSAQGELIGAPVSDNGYIILAKFFDDDGLEANDDTALQDIVSSGRMPATTVAWERYFARSLGSVRSHQSPASDIQEVTAIHLKNRPI